MIMPQAKNLSPLLVAAAVIITEGNVLLTRRPEGKPQAGFWEFPGGKIEPGESPNRALKREIREELGLQIEVLHITEVLFHSYDWGDVLILAYQCRIISGTPRNIEVAEHRWVPLQDLHQFNLLPADAPLIKKLQR